MARFVVGLTVADNPYTIRVSPPDADGFVTVTVPNCREVFRSELPALRRVLEALTPAMVADLVARKRVVIEVEDATEPQRHPSLLAWEFLGKVTASDGRKFDHYIDLSGYSRVVFGTTSEASLAYSVDEVRVMSSFYPMFWEMEMQRTNRGQEKP